MFRGVEEGHRPLLLCGEWQGDERKQGGAERQPMCAHDSTHGGGLRDERGVRTAILKEATETATSSWELTALNIQREPTALASGTATALARARARPARAA